MDSPLGGIEGYDNAQYERKPGGTIIIDGQEVANTLQCCHCGKHWISRRGSGITRGFCLKCEHVTCGATACNDCIPYLKKLDLAEKGKLIL